MSKMSCALLGLICLARVVIADDIFVDDMMGVDSNDGSLSTPQQGDTGPVRTLGRAMQLATSGDTIILKNNGIPYYESISLTGSKHSGTPYRPFIIVGNGAAISGLRTLPREGWRKEKEKIWKLTLTRKGYYLFLRDGQLLPEYVPESGVNPLEQLGAGQWVAWKGNVYYRQDGLESPDLQNFAFAADQTGISLHHVQNVLIVDLVVQHFRFDGIHAQGLCDGVELQKVTCVENGRGGIVASGASTIDIFGGTVERNGRFQVMALDRSKAEAHELVEQE